MYNQSKGLTFFLLAAVSLASGLTALGIWYEVFYFTDDSGPETVKAVFMNIGGAVATSLLTMGVVEVVMVLSRYIIEQYRKERDERVRAEGRKEGRERGMAEGRERGMAEGRERGMAEGREEMAQKWQAWNQRRQAAEDRGEPFDESPPLSPLRAD